MRKREFQRVVVWFLSGLLSFVFISEGLPKVLNAPGIAAQFLEWGYPPWLLKLVGGVEVGAGVLVMIPPAAFLAASALVGMMIGAAYTHLVHGEYLLFLKPAFFLCMIAVVLWLRRPRVGPHSRSAWVTRPDARQSRGLSPPREITARL